MKIMNHNYVRNGYLLIEVLISVVLIATTLTALVSLQRRSLSISDTSRNESVATRYAQESIEWIRKIRDEEGWIPFEQALSPSKDFCLNQELEHTFTNFLSLPSDCTGQALLQQIFTRTMHITITAGQANIVSEVSWQDGGRTHKTTKQTILYSWNN